MRLFVGLGNPGPKHQMNRHNIGFMALDTIFQRHKFPAWSKNFQSLVSEGMLDNQKVMLIKPQTFMNVCGQVIYPAMAYFKIPLEDVIVFHDDIDLAPGRIKTKKGGGAAGHNGLRSIDQNVGPDYWRIRLGVGRPEMQEQVSDFVLGDFNVLEAEWLVPMLAGLALYAPTLAKGEAESYTEKVARQIPVPKGPTIN